MTDKEIEVIIKSIFTKMFDDDFSACEYGIECYKKGMEYQGIKELAIENDNLIKQVRTLKAQIEKMKCGGNCKHEYWINTGGCYDQKCRFTGLDCTNCKDKWEIK